VHLPGHLPLRGFEVNFMYYLGAKVKNLIHFKYRINTYLIHIKYHLYIFSLHKNDILKIIDFIVEKQGIFLS